MGWCIQTFESKPAMVVSMKDSSGTQKVYSDPYIKGKKFIHAALACS